MTLSRPDLSGAISPDAVVERVMACRSVTRISPGPVGEVATYLPGRRVPGVRLGDDRIEIHVVARWGVRVPDLAADVRAAVQPIAAGFLVDVHVDDVEVPNERDDFEIQLPSD